MHGRAMACIVEGTQLFTYGALNGKAFRRKESVTIDLNSIKVRMLKPRRKRAGGGLSQLVGKFMFLKF
ncbi:unnamed protein product [Blepharisma stoltei]|uniref:Uncharacterized protein n=1 Tax=Blepharisma stoltei TaxID=1481888 RepID=A0AAU9K2L9_9CILI|nr:unnamed protein product [Blepharisma stoltei]